ncbi:MAG: glycerol-3-phosphate 1-O-acyltransferase PlsY [Phycisphaerae bacterium]
MLIAMLLLIGAYLLGAIPFGLLIGRAHGIDIRQRGSGNIGATNAGRVLGRKWGLMCLALDLLKGLAPTLAAGWLLGLLWSTHSIVDWPLEQRLSLWVAAGLAAVVGHVCPVYLGFRGGKGVSTTIGVALGIYPCFTFAMIVALAAYGVIRYATRTVSAGSIAIAVVFPAALFAYTSATGLPVATGWPLHATAIGLGLLILVRHRSNIARLWSGTELRAPKSDDAASKNTE